MFHVRLGTCTNRQLIWRMPGLIDDEAVCLVGHRHCSGVVTTISHFRDVAEYGQTQKSTKSTWRLILKILGYPVDVAGDVMMKCINPDLKYVRVLREQRTTSESRGWASLGRFKRLIPWPTETRMETWWRSRRKDATVNECTGCNIIHQYIPVTKTIPVINITHIKFISYI